LLSVLEHDVIIGCFTHRLGFVEHLEESIQKFLPEIPFIKVINPASTAANITLLWHKFIESGKRYWLYIDDDVRILNSGIVNNAIINLINGKYAAITSYLTFDESVLINPYNPKEKGLIARAHNFCDGHFMLVDSWRVGHISPADMLVPNPNLAVSAIYSVAIRADGWECSITDDFVWHDNRKREIKDIPVIPTEEYLRKKYGDFYFEWTAYGGQIIEYGMNPGRAGY
jgi:hypothetical protein